MMNKLPRSQVNDYTQEIAAERRRWLSIRTGAALEHVGAYSMDPGLFVGNVEQFIGVAQVPIGLAGPILVHGEHAQGEYMIPLATTEGTLVASYNRGMKLTRMAGGIKVHVIDDRMNRAPVFVFGDAGQARDFGLWIREHGITLKEVAGSTSNVAKLIEIEQYTASKIIWLRFNYQCGDAAGQNMVTKATHAAAQWILAHQKWDLEYFSLAGNLDTDKKHSYINYLHTRGKRVVAEIIIPDKMIREVMRTSARALHAQRKISNIGAILGGSINNGAHAANGITAMFIATGQDVANVAESSAAIVHADVMPNGDYYFSITIPSLVVATYGGGTNLPTQRECLQIMDCYGQGKVLKLAEIVAAVVLAGDLSLSSAILADEWVSSHEQMGRNR